MVRVHAAPVQDSTQQNSTRQGRGDPQAILRDLDLRDRPLADVVEFIRQKSGVNIVMDDNIDARVTLKLKNVDWRTALELAVEKAKCVVIQKGSNVLKVEKPPRVRFAFDQADITKVIDAVSKISGANIITAPEVQGTITLRLKDVPWRDALEQIVKTLGFTVVEEDRDILRVVSPATLVDQLTSKSFQLRYVRPQSTFVPKIASQYVEGSIPRPSGDPAQSFSILQALRRMLTEAGNLEYIDRQNVILVKDTKPVVDEMAQMIQMVDIEPRQVFVDVKFVTTRNTDVLEYGFNIGDTGWGASLSLGSIPTRLPFDLGRGGFEDEIIAHDPGTEPGPFLDPNKIATGAQVQLPATIFGALDFTGVVTALRLLKKDDTSEIVQAPKIIALDHQEATIFVGDTVRFAQSRAEQGQAGGLTLVVEEAPGSPVSTGFQLFLVPHIVPGTDKVMLEVIPEAESLTGTGGPPLAPSGFDVFTVGSGSGTGSIALPRISSSTISTKMLLRSGQTAVIGGLTTESSTKTDTRVPFLGDIPIIGWAFRHQSTTKTRNSLIVFITPEIIQTPEETEESIRRVLSERQRAMQAEYRQIFGVDEEDK
ncbi:MAG: type II secretion system protein GspD [Planctomycetota bacterium]